MGMPEGPYVKTLELCTGVAALAQRGENKRGFLTLHRLPSGLRSRGRREPWLGDGAREKSYLDRLNIP
jgi:hypothetical protein